MKNRYVLILMAISAYLGYLFRQPIVKTITKYITLGGGTVAGAMMLNGQCIDHHQRTLDTT